VTKDDQTTRETPAKDEDDWQSIWKAVERSEKLWWLIGPLHAVVSSWKAILAVVALVAWLSRDDIRAALIVLMGS
jgi:hypothetical protein